MSTGGGHAEDKLTLRPRIAGPKLHRPDTIRILFIPTYQGLRACPSRLYSINFLGQDLAQRGNKVAHVTLCKPLCRHRGMMSREGKGCDQSGTRMQTAKVLLGQSRILPALVHVQRETWPDPHQRLLMTQGGEFRGGTLGGLNLKPGTSDLGPKDGNARFLASLAAGFSLPCECAALASGGCKQAL